MRKLAAGSVADLVRLAERLAPETEASLAPK
jgi:hypothetical protein